MQSPRGNKRKCTELTNFTRLLEILFGSEKVAENIKVMLHRRYHLPVLKYRAETWLRKC
jgi:hypothetical protein